MALEANTESCEFKNQMLKPQLSNRVYTHSATDGKDPHRV